MWALSDEQQSTLEQFRDALGVDMPILLDERGQVRQQYAMVSAFPTAAYPQEWLVGVDGTIVYFNNELEVDALSAAIEAELAKLPQAR